MPLRPPVMLVSMPTLLSHLSYRTSYMQSYFFLLCLHHSGQERCYQPFRAPWGLCSLCDPMGAYVTLSLTPVVSENIFASLCLHIEKLQADMSWCIFSVCVELRNIGVLLRPLAFEHGLCHIFYCMTVESVWGQNRIFMEQTNNIGMLGEDWRCGRR